MFLNRGLRQGDPASGYLFLLAAEILANQIRMSTELKGIDVGEGLGEIRISQYADDTLIFIDGTDKSVNGVFKELDVYGSYSGLQINQKKRACLGIGTFDRNGIRNDLNLKWSPMIKVLIIKFTQNAQEITTININDKIDDFDRVLGRCKKRKLTPIGGICVAKSLALAKLVHLLVSLPTPEERHMKYIQKALFDFIWMGKRDKVKRTRLVQPHARGGLNMIDIQGFEKSLKVAWMKRLLISSAIWARFARKHMVTDIDNVILYGGTKLTQVRKTMGNQFWTDVIRAWESFIRMWKPRSEQIITERLWFSDKTPYRSTVVRNWDKKGFRFFGDLFDADSKEMLSREELCEKIGLRINFLNPRPAGGGRLNAPPQVFRG